MVEFGYHRGLDLGNVEVTTADEIKEFRSQVLDARGGKLMYPLSAYSVVLNNRPDMLKLHFRQMETAKEIEGEEGSFASLPVTVMLHWYICNRYEEGIIHEVRGCQREGATKAEVNEILAIAFMHCGPSGMRFVYHAAFDYLESYVEPEHRLRWPAGWAPDPAALQSGMDFRQPGMSERDRQALFTWYEANLGEIPQSAQFLAKHNPEYLKAWRAKLEGTMRGALPKQFLPYAWLHYDINRGFKSGIREAALLARAWGMTKEQLVNCVTFSTGYMAGLGALDLVQESIGDLLDKEWASTPTPV